MEGNFYLNAQLDDRFSLVMNRGLYDGFEIYGMGYILPAHGYFRVGKFQPAYGWRFDDHTSFVREKMLWPANSTDTGVEFGIYPNDISITAGFYNGADGFFDDGKGKALSSRLELRRNIRGLGFGMGGSYYYNDTPSGDLSMYGPLYFLNVKSGKVVFIGEIDWLEDKRRGTAEVTSFATTNRLSVLASKGIWIEGTYDFYDPDLDYKTGAVSRYGIGVNYFPYGFIEVSPSVRYYDLSDEALDDYFTVNTTVHFFF
jgi:hypothetical protein